MPRTCSICSHPKREKIDKALCEGISYRSVAQQFAAPPDSVYRHKPHVAPIIARAFERRQDQFGDNLVQELQRLASEAANIGAAAKEAKQYGAAMGGVREMTRICELIAKLTGQLDESARVNILVQEREQREASQAADLSRLSLDERLMLARLLAKASGVDGGELGAQVESNSALPAPVEPAERAENREI